MKLTNEIIRSLNNVGRRTGLSARTLAAIIEVESNAMFFVPGTNLPLIRWEGHYFYRFLSGDQRTRAITDRLASLKSGCISNPSSQQGRYQLLMHAARIDSDAAFASISFGVGQIMGANYQLMGFASAQSMFQDARRGLEAQLLQLAGFIEAKKLRNELNTLDWCAFARAYNGPNYYRSGYHLRLAQAYAELQSDHRLESENCSYDTQRNAVSALRLGSSGVEVRELQQLLVRAGIKLNIDGDFGPATKRSVEQFQSENGLKSDGIVGPKTSILLSQYMSPREENLGRQSVLNLRETAAGGITSLGGLSTVTVADKLEDTASRLSESDGTMNTLANGLYVIGAALIIGSFIWVAYGWLKASKVRQA
ncbi:N-acetylmuramidase domain-containing protein [Brucella intermedia]|uniref:N-acetylmuramidase domain-containing protein n=1 Tax=Brucella intermedia TaxID=94625 RepID=UPI00124E2D1C|nr:N-acetylmuramidase domain-containing protein [Brucella intermedia]KAB2689883.1 DUF3380 domain-containing protein [Brucella intermedia]